MTVYVRTSTAMVAILLIELLGSLFANPARAEADWPMYNGGYAGQRYVRLRQISPSNAFRLRQICYTQFEPQWTAFETGPVVVGNRIYVTTIDSTFSLDATNCHVIWKATNKNSKRDWINVNRGVAYYQGLLFRGNSDGSVVALNARSGRTFWQKQILKSGETFTMAPIAWKGRLFIGSAVGDNRIVGSVISLNTHDGRVLWRTSTIDARSWPRGSETGGGGVWTSFAIDEHSGELFTSIGNAAPDFLASARPGDNLFTDSALVLDARSGKIKWWYQVTPRDEHDWDLGAAPMLFRDGFSRDLMALGSKDGHLYVVDRRNRRLLYARQVTSFQNAHVKLTDNPLHVCPGSIGGVEWNGPAYDPRNGTVVVGSVDWCGTYVQTAAGLTNSDGLGGSYATDSWSAARGWVTAVDASTGIIRWRYHSLSPIVAGITPTAGGIVLTGDTGGSFLVLDSRNGHLVAKRRLAGPVVGGVVSYMVGAKQFVAAATGQTLRTTFAPNGRATLTILAFESGRVRRGRNPRPLIIKSNANARRSQLSQPVINFGHVAAK